MSTNLNNVSDDEIILAWRKAEAKLAEYKAEEMRLRKLVIAAKFQGHKEEGTENVELGNGYKLKAVFKLNYNLGNADDVNAALSKMEKLGAEGKFLAERIVSWKPSLSVKEYRDLPERYKPLIDEVLTTSEGSPSLELVEPKSKK